MKKKAKIIIGILNYTWSPYGYLNYLKKLAQTRAEKSVREYFVREKVKWTNKGTDKRYVAVSFIHSATYHYQALYQI